MSVESTTNMEGLHRAKCYLLLFEMCIIVYLTIFFILSIVNKTFSDFWTNYFFSAFILLLSIMGLIAYRRLMSFVKRLNLERRVQSAIFLQIQVVGFFLIDV